MSLTYIALGLSGVKHWVSKFGATGKLCAEFVVTLDFFA